MLELAVFWDSKTVTKELYNAKKRFVVNVTALDSDGRFKEQIQICIRVDKKTGKLAVKTEDKTND